MADEEALLDEALVANKIKDERKMFKNMESILKEIYPTFNEKDNEKSLEAELIEKFVDYTTSKGKKYEGMKTINKMFLDTLTKIKKETMEFKRAMKDVVDYWENYPIFLNKFEIGLKSIIQSEKDVSKKEDMINEEENESKKKKFEGRDVKTERNKLNNKKKEFKTNLGNYEIHRIADNLSCILHLVINELKFSCQCAKIYSEAFNEINDTKIEFDIKDFISQTYPNKDDFDNEKLQKITGIDFDKLEEEQTYYEEEIERTKKKTNSVFNDDDDYSQTKKKKSKTKTRTAAIFEEKSEVNEIDDDEF